MKKRRMKHVCHIWAIRLDDEVLDKGKFAKRDPDYRSGKPCCYIGSSVCEPAQRLRKHKAGQRASTWVRKYGLCVAAKKCCAFETADRGKPAKVEHACAEKLRNKGVGIWQN